MTRDELIEELESIIFHHELEGDETRDTATVILDTIFAALKDSTEQMDDAARHLMMWLDGYPRPTYKNLTTHCRLMGKPLPNVCPNIDHVPPKAQRLSWIWQAMISASPLAPNNKENKQ